MYYPLLFSSALSSSSLLFSLPISRPRKKQYRRRATPNSQAAAAVAAVAPGPFPHVRPGQRHYTSYERKNAHTHTHTHTHTRTHTKPRINEEVEEDATKFFCFGPFPFLFSSPTWRNKNVVLFPGAKDSPTHAHTHTYTHTHMHTHTYLPLFVSHTGFSTYTIAARHLCPLCRKGEGSLAPPRFFCSFLGVLLSVFLF